jgi:hypothetical protein
MNPTRLDYCQFLLSSQVNFTLTHYADHHAHFSHDALNRYLSGERITSRMVWENVKPHVIASQQGHLIFDDTVLDKTHSQRIELVRRQYSGNAHGVIKGIGMVNCVYVNPESGQYWIIDYRLFAPEQDGKSKLDHVRDMLDNVLLHKRLPVRTVLMDTWYATSALMAHVASKELVYYCPLKDNRHVAADSAGQQQPYQRVDSLSWTPHELHHGKLVKVKNFPPGQRVKLFRVTVSTRRTDWIVTNDLAQDSTDATQDACGVRWKIEQFHRELKQLTGAEKCQCRRGRMQRNHIACSVLVWNCLAALARKAGKTLYHLKRELLSSYLRAELASPAVAMTLVA